LLTAAHVETDPKTRGFFSERRQIGEGTSQAAKSSMQKGGNKPLEVTSKAEPAARGVCKNKRKKNKKEGSRTCE